MIPEERDPFENGRPEEEGSTGPQGWVMPPEWRPCLPEEMKQFRLDHIIGKGSTGTVYHATRTQEYAVKVISWTDPDQRAAAMRDYEISRALSDGGKTVRSFACCENEGEIFIVQELGEACLDHFAWRRCTLREVLEVLLQTAESIEYIHDSGYTHFDVKPQNIVIVEGRAKVADFSHSRKNGQCPVYEATIGTGAFRAPEVVKGEPCSGKEDMYSLGITMFALLTGGRVPFDVPEDGVFQRGPEEQIRTFFIHADLLKIIQKAAAFRPEERFSSFREFSEAIRSFMTRYADSLEEEIPGYRMLRTIQKTIPQVTAEDWERSILS